MTTIQPTRELRKRAVKMQVAGRATSAAATAIALGGIWYVAPPGGQMTAIGALNALIVVLGALMLALVSPLGTLLSIFTVWCGLWVSSCPNCPDFNIRRVEAEYMECDSCGKRDVSMAPIYGPGWVRRPGTDGHGCRACEGLP